MVLSVAFSLALISSPTTPHLDKFDRLMKLIDERYIYTQKLNIAPPTAKLPVLQWHVPETLQEELIQNSPSWSNVKAHYRQKTARDPNHAESYLKRTVAWLGDNHSVYLTADEVQSRDIADLACVSLEVPTQPENATTSEPKTMSQSTESASTDIAQPSPEGSEDTPPEPETVHSRLVGSVGVVRIENLIGFAVSGQVADALESLAAQGAKGFVLDVQNNPGGQALEMTRIAGLFTKGVLWRMRLKGSLPIPLPAVGNAEYSQMPLAVVVNGNSHSAAEGLSGGLQYAGKAKVFGRTSAGNVEAVYPYCLSDGGLLLLASGQLAPFRGNTWEGKGVVPDFPETTIEDAVNWVHSQLP